jgi:hypothetical protein
MTATNLAARAAAGLRDLSQELAEELERKPRVVELLEILAAGLAACRDDVLADVRPDAVTALAPKLKRGAKAAPPDAEALRGLNDGVYSSAASLIADLSRAHRAARGGPPTLDELCALLAEGFRGAPADLLADLPPSSITGVKATAPKRPKLAASVGDVVAIPAQDGGFHHAVVLAKNRLGVAYGPLQGSAPAPGAAPRLARAAGRPVFSDDGLVGSRRWKVVGHEPSLLQLFPAPEIYHRPMNIPGVPSTEPYGAAETGEGVLRLLSKEEAEAAGVLGGTYRQFHLGQALERYLDGVAGAAPRS